ncbi:hypothetical protein C8A03DRAFT_19845 [Achaetomium macrosporum]|uniref:Uncharacterized protein n=1 Tax=Achaetomium macrosporum TaxID=79813 RepID=A0AAN7H638_9PEZI|nr:hypothetical protein C8A03DRAFT_19845 [Achaetomium macrosporum]
MNKPESTNKLRPPQALAPTGQLYDELVGDGMEKLAKATVAEILPIHAGSVVPDDGCGTGAGTAAAVNPVCGDGLSRISIRGIDINEGALEVYKTKAAREPMACQSYPSRRRQARLFLPSTRVPYAREVAEQFELG